MKVAKVLGIIGGVLGLLFGLVAFGVSAVAGGIAGQIGVGADVIPKAMLVSVVALGLPIMSIIGGVIAEGKPRAALICMAVPAVAFFALAFASSNAVAALPGVLMGIGAILVMRNMNTASVAS